MSHLLSSDSRGLIVPCPSCGTASRIAYANLAKTGRCGACKATLPVPAAPVVVEDSASFQALTTGSALPVLVDFWAPWCGPCRMMAPEFEKAATQAAGSLILAKVNSDDLPAVSASLHIQGIPAFVLFKDGKEQARTAGFQPAQRLVAWASQNVR